MTIQGVSKKLASWKIASIFKLVLSLILISSHIYNLGMLASTETKNMNTSSFPRTGGSFTKDPFSDLGRKVGES